MHGLLRDMGQDIGTIDGSHFWECGIANAIVANGKVSYKVYNVYNLFL